jgi:thiol-disulfide isomerase/thioredoxin
MKIMKVKHLALLATVSLFSMTTFAKPEAGSRILSEIIGKQALANPCASKANPCAAKGKTVGGPLAKTLRGKPVVVDIYASWCPACKNIAPTLSQLKKQYAGKVHFVVLDVSNRATTAKSEMKAKELGLSQFFTAHKTQTGSLTIVDPATGRILAQHRNNPNKSDYTKVLDSALAKK